MKCLAFAVSAALSATAFAGPQDEITMHIELVTAPADVFYNIDKVPFRTELSESLQLSDGGIGDAAVAIDQIVNIGQKVWDVIKANEAVLNVKHDYANALPKGVRSAEELDGFSDLQARGVRLFGKNLYGATVYDVTLTAVHQYGGSYEGRGKFLETVTLLPSFVDVMWGYTLDVGVTRISAVNHGTSQDPVAGLTMEGLVSVSTVMQKHQQRMIYQFRGDSQSVRTAGINVAR